MRRHASREEEGRRIDLIHLWIIHESAVLGEAQKRLEGSEEHLEQSEKNLEQKVLTTPGIGGC